MGFLLSLRWMTFKSAETAEVGKHEEVAHTCIRECRAYFEEKWLIKLERLYGKRLQTFLIYVFLFSYFYLSCYYYIFYLILPSTPLILTGKKSVFQTITFFSSKVSKSVLSKCLLYVIFKSHCNKTVLISL